MDRFEELRETRLGVERSATRLASIDAQGNGLEPEAVAAARADLIPLQAEIARADAELANHPEEEATP